MPIIQLRRLHHRYPSGTHALRGINLSIEAGERVAIIGQNGSGKTTLAKHLNGLLRATEGEVVIKGQLVGKRKVSELSRIVGYCFQNPDHQIFCETVEEEVAYGPKNLGLSKGEIEQRVNEALGAVRLAQSRDESPRDLSRGQRQALAVASVLSMRPEILVVDEPTTGQDYQDGVAMMELTKRLNEAGHTVLFIMHDMPMVAKYAERVIVLRDGQLLCDGTTREVFGQPELLRSTFLAPPQITQLGQAFPDLCPETVLSVKEMVDATLAAIRGNGRG